MKVKGGEEAHRWQRVRLRDRLLLLTKAFTCASLECGASSAFDSDPGGVPDVPARNESEKVTKYFTGILLQYSCL